MNNSLEFWKRLTRAEKNNFCTDAKLTFSYISSVLNGNDANHVRFSKDTAERFLKAAENYHGGTLLLMKDIPHNE